MTMALESTKNIWVLKSVPDSDRSSQTIESYKDEAGKSYNYDSNVPNAKKIKIGDQAIIINKKIILGIAEIQDITITKGVKTILKCPECNSSNISKRLKLTPVYKCNDQHFFDHPKSDQVDVTRYSAKFQDSYVPVPNSSILLSDLRPFYVRNYNPNLSMQFVSNDVMSLFQQTSWQFEKNTTTDLSPEITLNEPENPYIYNNEDERITVERQLQARRGQKQFRDGLINRYGAKCMVTNCSILSIIEAAHINPYRGQKDNHGENGLLLRADIHTLYDLNLIAIEPISFTIHISDKIKGSEYSELQGTTLKITSKKPSEEAIKNRWIIFNTLLSQ
ncbi:HNH endonuclease [Pedobacter gandavensis]|uniref:HNH nuclease domain-containing protein n=1 Tax=Pedobacter gandavensis TaxID=2679963 RepID=A0ABR6ER40_9SPHI|nr:HNH endonuclease signature motif containing protein [Pedobacter gandavensis]MBB2147652.1 hypothetical protein [Pedobacter gandavensis]